MKKAILCLALLTPLYGYSNGDTMQPLLLPQTRSVNLYSVGCMSTNINQFGDYGITGSLNDPICQNLKIADAYNKALSLCADQGCSQLMRNKIIHHLQIASNHAERMAELDHYATAGTATARGTLAYAGPPTLGWLLLGVPGAVIGGGITAYSIATQ